MDNLFIEGKEFVPEINFNAGKNHLSISGESYHEYTHEFYDPVMDWLEKYLSSPGKEFVFDFNMTYFNTAASKCLYDIIEMLRDYKDKKNGKVTVNWYYQKNDYDMLETGEEYILDSGLAMNLLPY